MRRERNGGGDTHKRQYQIREFRKSTLQQTAYGTFGMYCLKMGRMVWDFEQVKEIFKAKTFQFIVSELDLAITFVSVASCTKSAETAARNLRHASTAYNAAGRFLERTTLEPEMADYVSRRIQRLLALLEELQRRHPRVQ
jgi:hypothetical protein